MPDVQHTLFDAEQQAQEQPPEPEAVLPREQEKVVRTICQLQNKPRNLLGYVLRMGYNLQGLKAQWQEEEFLFMEEGAPQYNIAFEAWLTKRENVERLIALVQQAPEKPETLRRKPR